jgi:translation initiation factor 2B subunit (eIF-2B alpha/beta/delta family)
LRAASYIRNVWTTNCDWDTDQRLHLAEICIYHRRKHNLQKMRRSWVHGKHGTVRRRELAAILRLADACHVDGSRAPGDLKNLYLIFGMPTASLVHWGMPQFITNVIFDHSTRSIRLECDIPAVATFGTATVDFKPAVEQVIKAGLETELASVSPWLVAYPNTGFSAVEADFDRPLAMSNSDIYMRDLWPYLLSIPYSASEEACLVAGLLKAITTLDGVAQVAEDKVQMILKFSKRLHPYNFLVRDLEDRINDFLSRDKSVYNFGAFLEAYLTERKDALATLASEAVVAMPVTDQDWLVVYGYSHSIMALLRQPKFHGHKGRILIVECRRRSGLEAAGCDESERLAEELQALGLTYRHVRMESLAVIFAYCRKQKQGVKVVLGARGIYDGGEALCTIGNATIAILAKQSDVPVYLLAEQAKRQGGNQLKSDITAQLEQLASKLANGGSEGRVRPWPSVDVLIDVLDKDLYLYPIQHEVHPESQDKPA